MADTASGQGEANPVFWLAARAGKMDLSFPTRRSPKTFSFWPCNKLFIEQACSVKMAEYAVADPDLQIKWGGDSHPDFEIRRGGFQKKIFRPFGPHFALYIRGGAPPDPLPWIRRWYGPSSFCVFINIDFISLHKNAKTNMTYMQQSWPVKIG